MRIHDFIDPELGKVIPYGVYDIDRNAGWVNVGVDHDTAQFAVESLRGWWKTMGAEAYPASRLMVTADCGGSNGYRSRGWKYELQRFADESGLEITVCHFPPGTSKWNKIEHRLFSQITQNWRGRPLISHEVVVNLIANRTTRTGLRVRAALDVGSYPTGTEISDEGNGGRGRRSSRVPRGVELHGPAPPFSTEANPNPQPAGNCLMTCFHESPNRSYQRVSLPARADRRGALLGKASAAVGAGRGRTRRSLDSCGGRGLSSQ